MLFLYSVSGEKSRLQEEPVISSSSGDRYLLLQQLKAVFIPLSKNHREIGKDKDKCDGGEDEDGKEQNTPRGRKTANSQGRRNRRITTRSMANEAASVAAEDTPPPTSEPALPDPPQLPKSDQAQKGMKEPAKSLTPVAADANKGENSHFTR